MIFFCHYLLDLPKQTFSRRIFMSDKNFRISLIVMVAFAIPIVASVIIGCIVRRRNLRMKLLFVR